MRVCSQPLLLMESNACLRVTHTHTHTHTQAEQYAVTATPSRMRRAPGGDVTTDEDKPGREEKGLLDEHLQTAAAQTKFT